MAKDEKPDALRNYVAKNARSFCKAVVHRDRKHDYVRKSKHKKPVDVGNGNAEN